MADQIESILRVFPSQGVPIYRQVMDQVRLLVLSGRVSAGDLLPSVRSVAAALAVNPMTVSKAYSLLEAEGLVERVRGLGMRVCEQSAESLPGARMAEMSPLLHQVASRAHQLALSRDQVLGALAPLLSTLTSDQTKQAR